MFYFVGILSRVGDLFLQGCPYVFFLLNVRFKDIYELHKSPIKKKKNFLNLLIDSTSL